MSNKSPSLTPDTPTQAEGNALPENEEKTEARRRYLKKEARNHRLLLALHQAGVCTVSIPAMYYASPEQPLYEIVLSPEFMDSFYNNTPIHNDQILVGISAIIACYSMFMCMGLNRDYRRVMEWLNALPPVPVPLAEQSYVARSTQPQKLLTESIQETFPKLSPEDTSTIVRRVEAIEKELRKTSSLLSSVGLKKALHKMPLPSDAEKTRTRLTRHIYDRLLNRSQER